MKRFKKQQQGFSLIEILIGIAIFAIIFVGVSYLLVDNLQASFDNQEKIKADFLVSEGLEAVKAIAGNDWDQIKAGTYGLALIDYKWQLVADPETVSQMAKNGERIITITDLDGDNIKKIDSKVVWMSIMDKVKESSASTLLTNWQEYVSVCSDGLDNDGDGAADYPNDPGCDSPEDEDEYDSGNPTDLPDCSDGLDNDNDGIIDYPNEPGCDSGSDDDETDPDDPTECSDNLDNDADGNADYPNDPGCESGSDDDENDPINPPQCSDFIDNDGDGNVDYPADLDCESADDDDETDSNDPTDCSDNLDNDNDGNIDYPDDLGCESAYDDDETDPVCGNGSIESLEECDDSNTQDGDGCSSQCMIETDPDAVCGNGVIESSEECDIQTVPNGCEKEIESCQHNCKCKVPICHVTSSETNPYELLWVSYDAVDGEGSNDHSHHLGDIIPISDVNEDGEINEDDCYASPQIIPDVIFDDEDTPLCKLEEDTIIVTGTVVLPEGATAKLRLSYYIVWPEDKRTEITYINKGIVSNGDTYSIVTPWPGVRKDDTRVETHVGAMLLDAITNEPIMANSSRLNYYWYPWVCSPLQPECSDGLDNDNDGQIDYPGDDSCVSDNDDNEGTDDCGSETDNNYDVVCNQDNEDDDVEIKIENNNDRGFSDVAISLPAGVVPLEPQNNDVYVGVVGTYKVEITNNPFYSIKFNNIGADGYKNGEKEIFVIRFSPDDYDRIEEIEVQSKSALIIGNVIFTF